MCFLLLPLLQMLTSHSELPNLQYVLPEVTEFVFYSINLSNDLCSSYIYRILFIHFLSTKILV